MVKPIGDGATSCAHKGNHMSNTTRTHALPALVAFALALAGTFSVSSALADPPTRVARLSNIDGTVTFSPAGDDQWVQAILNRPVITGDRLWSDNGGRVELSLDNGALWLGSMTSLVASNIDDRTTQLELQQGTLEFRVRRMTPGSTIEIDTPNLAFQVTHPGRYRLDVDPQSGSTTVEVRAGGAEVYGERASYALASGQGYRFYGTDLNDSEYFAPPNADEFDRYAGERDARFDSVASARYVSPEVVGYEDLDRYGSWNSVSSYGNVWFPRQVASEWAPYRDGHWSWIDPWGWTWVDDAPWGFAPFHYGRWAYVSNRWGWIPGPVNVRPVYAPALVAFVGGAGFSISVSSGPAIGWIPLGPARSLSTCVQREPRLLSAGQREQHGDQQHGDQQHLCDQCHEHDGTGAAGEFRQPARTERRDRRVACDIRAIAARQSRARAYTECRGEQRAGAGGCTGRAGASRIRGCGAARTSQAAGGD